MYLGVQMLPRSNANPFALVLCLNKARPLELRRVITMNRLSGLRPKLWGTPFLAGIHLINDNALLLLDIVQMINELRLWPEVQMNPLLVETWTVVLLPKLARLLGTAATIRNNENAFAAVLQVNILILSSNLLNTQVIPLPGRKIKRCGFAFGAVPQWVILVSPFLLEIAQAQILLAFKL